MEAKEKYKEEMSKEHFISKCIFIFTDVHHKTLRKWK